MTEALGPGVKVRCIREGAWFGEIGQLVSGPAFGSVWRIDKVRRQTLVAIGEFGHIYDGPWLQLAKWPEARLFHASQFVPIQDGEEEMKRLTALLTGLKDPGSEPAPVREIEEIDA